MLHPECFEPELTHDERALRDKFVIEYMRDFRPLDAALRTGFIFSFAQKFADDFMQCGYVRRQISYRKQEMDAADEAEEEKRDKRLAKTTLREVALNGGASARVAAVRTLGDLYGWKPEEGDGTGETALIDALKEFAKSAHV